MEILKLGDHIGTNIKTCPVCGTVYRYCDADTHTGTEQKDIIVDDTYYMERKCYDILYLNCPGCGIKNILRRSYRGNN